METKILIYYIIQNFTMEITGKTEVPIQMSRAVGGFLPDKGVWVEFRPRA
jgi:cytochrome P450 family 9